MLDVGQSIGRCQIDLKLGEGGMGSVFRAHDVGEHEDSPYIVMEYVPGATLRTLLACDEIPWRRRLGWLLDRDAATQRSLGRDSQASDGELDQAVAPLRQTSAHRRQRIAAAGLTRSEAGADGLRPEGDGLRTAKEETRLRRAP
jgi:hypothetical protein